MRVLQSFSKIEHEKKTSRLELIIETGVELTLLSYQDTGSDSFPCENHTLNFRGSMLASY